MIRIKNIYYMLTYAYSTLNEKCYQDLLVEDFEYAADLFAVILSKGTGNQIRRGLGKGYLSKSEALSRPIGKISMSESIKDQTIVKKQLVCDFDEYSENIYVNQILKTTIKLLLESGEVQIKNKKALKKNLMYLNNVDLVNPFKIKWKHVRYDRNNATYKMLLNICYLVINGMLMSEEKGTTKLLKYIDDQHMHRLYEKFLLEYYRKTYKDVKVSSSHIDWSVDDGFIDLLPVMKSDIMIENKGKILIIDAKYYSRTMQHNPMFNSRSIHSNNLYQIFTYVKNKAFTTNKEVSGILLYARTDEDIQPDNEYLMSGNRIGVKILDLSIDFTEIQNQLQEIHELYIEL